MMYNSYDVVKLIFILPASDPANVPGADRYLTPYWSFSADEALILMTDFKEDINAYLSELHHTSMKTLDDLIQFNLDHAVQEMPLWGQDLFYSSRDTNGTSSPAYLAALARQHRRTRAEGLDKVMNEYNLDALLVPSDPIAPSSQPANMACYPSINIPLGFNESVPFGITLMGRAYSEPTLLRIAYGIEQITLAHGTGRKPPKYIPCCALDVAVPPFVNSTLALLNTL